MLGIGGIMESVESENHWGALLGVEIIVVLRTKIIVSTDSGDSGDSGDSSDSTDSGDSVTFDLSCESRLCDEFGSQLCEINVSGDLG